MHHECICVYVNALLKHSRWPWIHTPHREQIRWGSERIACLYATVKSAIKHVGMLDLGRGIQRQRQSSMLFHWPCWKKINIVHTVFFKRTVATKYLNKC